MPQTLETFTFPPAHTRPMHALTNNAGLRLELQPNGCLRRITAGPVIVSSLYAEPLAGGMHRVYLRNHNTDGVTAEEIVGPQAQSAYRCDNAHAAWTGHALGLDYRCTLTPAPDTTRWAWHIEVTNATDRAATYDAILVQDVGLANEGMVRNNEKYTAQYVDHRIAEHPELGPVVMSRQALPQHEAAHPWLIAGCVPRGTGVLTDAVRFFGAAHKADGAPALRCTPRLPTEVVQHEAAAHVLQSEPQTVAPGASSHCGFGFVFERDHPEPSADADTAKLIPSTFDAPPPTGPADEAEAVDTPPVQTLFQTAPLCSGADPTDEDLFAWFGAPDTWRHVEHDETGHTLSFFSDGQTHVATARKETTLRRGHGHLLRTGNALLPTPGVLAATCYARGVFAAQVSLGNMAFGRMSAAVREPMNLHRAAGLRLLVELDDGWRQLAVPSAFAMTPGSCRWVYKLPKRTLEVSCAADVDEPRLRLAFRVLRGKPVRVLVSSHVGFGDQEDGSTTAVELDRDTGRWSATPDPATRLAQAYPEAALAMTFDEPEQLDAFGGDELLHHDAQRRGLPYVVARSRPVETLSWSITAATDPASLPVDPAPSIEDTAARAAAFWSGLIEPVTPYRVAQPPLDRGVLERLRDALPWMVHNALIHLSVPHGLEQFGGGGWGVRDVCQGPVELLLAQGRGEVIRDILRIVFRHQRIETGEWPQWFMREPFHAVQPHDCHGDIIVWPIKALCDYLEQTDDLAFLDEAIGYATTEPGFPFSETTETVRQHVRRALDRIAEQSIPGTALLRYGEGDWNDALQPAQPWMRERMVSPWTVALLQHTLSRLAVAVRRAGDTAWAAELQTRADEVAEDFRKWCVIGGQVAGIVLFDEGYATVEPLLHPGDTRTGITASLIPMNRGLLAGLYPPESAKHHLKVLREKLLAPDGARLMDRPPRYTGGTETWFKRAESAACFGREVGLMYVHAHLRYAEACAALGDGDAALRALGQINPVGIRDSVPHAGRRQANAYFSSSDAAFPDRRTADAEYARVYDGSVPVEGGWRIYSSGPGIVVNLVVRHLLGIRRFYDQLHLDPVPALRREIGDGTLELTMQLPQPVTARFVTGHHRAEPTLNGHKLDGITPLEHPYRVGGWSVPMASIEALLTGAGDVLTVPIPEESAS